MPPELRLSLIPSRKLKKYPGSSRLYCPCLNSQIVLCRFPLAILSIPFRARPKWTITRARPNSTSLVFLAGWYRLAASSCGRSRVIRPCLWLRMPPSSPPLFFFNQSFFPCVSHQIQKIHNCEISETTCGYKNTKKIEILVVQHYERPKPYYYLEGGIFENRSPNQRKTSKLASPGVRSLDIQNIGGEFGGKDKNTGEDEKRLKAHDV